MDRARVPDYVVPAVDSPLAALVHAGGGRSRLLTLSREISAPLGTIVKTSEWVLASRLTLEQSTCLETIRSTAEHLLKRISNALEVPGDVLTMAPRDAGTAAPRLRPLSLRLLLADDNPINRGLVTAMLEKRGHDVVAVENGRHVIDAAATGAFDVILMDLQMPEVDGLEATRAIRSTEQGTGRRIPIVALTARAMKGDRESCLSAGMDAYLAKPVHVAELVSLVERLGADEPTPASSEASGEPAIDLDDLLADTGGDGALVIELVALFQTEVPGMLADLRACLAAGDPDGVERAAHRLRGSVSSFGARGASDAALILEMMGRDHALSRAHARLVDLERELQRMSDALAPDCLAVVP